MADATDLASYSVSKVYALGGMLPIIEEHLSSDGDMSTREIEALIKINGIGPWCVNQPMQLHATGKSDYRSALRERMQALP